MITISNITKFIGETALYENASFQIYEGEKIGLRRPQGAGKKTLFRLIVGELQPDSAAISVQTMCVSPTFPQNVGEMKGRSALSEVLKGNKRINELAIRLNPNEENVRSGATRLPRNPFSIKWATIKPNSKSRRL